MVSAVGAEQAPMSDTQLYRAAENRQTRELTNCRIARFCHNYSISALMIILNDVKQVVLQKKELMFILVEKFLTKNIKFQPKYSSSSLINRKGLTPAGKVTSKLSTSFSLKLTQRSEAKSAKRSFASKYLKFLFLTRSFASRFQLHFAQPILAKLKLTINWSPSPQGLTVSNCEKGF